MVFLLKIIPKPPHSVRVIQLLLDCVCALGIMHDIPTAVLTARQAQLVYSKKLHPQYQGDHPSPIWKVSERAKTATASPRVQQLAQPKQLHPGYQPCRQVGWRVCVHTQ